MFVSVVVQLQAGETLAVADPAELAAAVLAELGGDAATDTVTVTVQTQTVIGTAGVQPAA